MISTPYFFAFVGVLAYFIGLCWVFYLNIWYKANATSDTERQANNAAWAVLISVAGVFAAAISGMMIILYNQL
jgi:hypothetical protein